ncbi:hypothetical protein CTAYLR_005366 [Chrysophaeum taylorii]|uniref:Fe/B12 periplasmic-binding domain-containing protein n=1 Tax=Chrysophaeum taylorii TaxID=2483200 RepID=A0AAD7XIG3_9STRA|nr:hypothetical protein CTAYLR_005366 [Chrysophaeum taylorii]
MGEVPRIITLIPSATEVVAACGLGDRIVGVTHECDWPEEAVRGRKVCTTSDISPHTMEQNEINRAVVGSLSQGHSLYGLDFETVRALQPTHVVTQSLCDVCSVSREVVGSTCARLVAGEPEIVNLEPGTLEDVIGTVEAVGRVFGATAAAARTVADVRAGLDAIRVAVEKHRASPVPRVAFCEWIDPVFTGGHWIPCMMRIAGAAYDMAKSGDRSAAWTPEQLVAYDPDVIIVACCGFDVARNKRDVEAFNEKQQWWRDLRAVRTGRVFACDANSYFARPGPRLLQGAGIIAGIVHGPKCREALGEALCPSTGWTRVDTTSKLC